MKRNPAYVEKDTKEKARVLTLSPVTEDRRETVVSSSRNIGACFFPYSPLLLHSLSLRLLFLLASLLSPRRLLTADPNMSTLSVSVFL